MFSNLNILFLIVDSFMSGIVDFRNTTEFLKRSQTNTGAVKVHSHYVVFLLFVPVLDTK